jgi:hypothetical protein
MSKAKRTGLTKKRANQIGYIDDAYEATPHGDRVALLKRALREMVRDRRLTLLEIQEAVAALSEMEN